MLRSLVGSEMCIRDRVYYLSLNSNTENLNKIFKKKNSFKGKIGIFDIKNNKINHRLNFYKIENQKLIEIF